MAVQPFPSPLRYPGGKLKVANYVKSLFMLNDLLDGDYAEPYAGGGSVALALLFGKYASRIFINDIDEDVFAFWYSVLNETEALIKLIEAAKVDITEWEAMRAFFDVRKEKRGEEHTLLARGFATFYLNRTNRSGILKGGVIGGRKQKGKWKVDARFNKKDLIQRIEKIAFYKDRIFLTNLDAKDFLATVVPKMNKRSLVYLDPPYFEKGQGLYPNAYNSKDHASVAKDVAKIKTPWLVSYDNNDDIKDLYKRYSSLEYGLYHSAANHEAVTALAGPGDSPIESTIVMTNSEEDGLGEGDTESEQVIMENIPKPRRKGKEIMFFSKGLITPKGVDDPSTVTLKLLYQLQLAF